MNPLTKRHGRCPATVLLVVAMILAWLAPGASAQYTESEVKAAYILNFAKWTKWPAKAFADADAPLTIGIFGDDSLGSALDKVCRGQIIGGHKISIKRSHRLDEMKACQIVFVSKSEAAQLGQILASFQGANILTVGESDRFARQGGAIGFVMSGESLRYEINLGNARRGGVEPTPELVRHGKIVGS